MSGWFLLPESPSWRRAENNDLLWSLWKVPGKWMPRPLRATPQVLGQRVCTPWGTSLDVSPPPLTHAGLPSWHQHTGVIPEMEPRRTLLLTHLYTYS